MVFIGITKPKMKKLKYHHYIFFTVLAIFVLFLIIWNHNFGDDKKIKWGATFSKLQAKELELDWVHTYGTMIDEINFQTIRLPIYWPDVEESPGNFNFSDYAWMVEKAAQKNIEIVPVIGQRVPRWPECHTPKFYQNLSQKELQAKIKKLITAEIIFFKKYKNIKKWQVNNEPFADFFGQCAPSNSIYLDEQIKLVKSLDSRPIIITEAGELSTWVKGAKRADILGISMYRMTWSKIFGWFYYPLPPAYYYYKSKIISLITDVNKIINTELQVEPWSKGIPLKDLEEFDQNYAMDIAQVKTNLEFAKKTGLQENYIWGIEWWYWQGAKKNNWQYWEFAKEYFK